MARISKGTRQKNIASTLNVPMLNVLAMEGLLLRRFCDSKPRFQGRLALLRTGTHGPLGTFVTICASDLRASPWESGEITPRDYARTFCSPECTKASPKGRQDPSIHSQRTLYSVRRLGPFGQFKNRIIIFLFFFKKMGGNYFYIYNLINN